MNPRTKEIYMYFLGAIVVLAGLVTVAMLIRFEVPAGSQQAVGIAVGLQLGLSVSVVNYFFGSSKGSSDKTALMSKSNDAPTGPTV